MARNDGKGISLAKGPVGLLGIAMLAWGILQLILGGHGFSASPVSGTVNGERFLGAEGNGWTNLLWIGAGALILLGSPTHWGAKSLALIVGLVLGAASVIALADGDDVFGIFAANGLTKLLWGVVGAALIVLSLLPRVGKKKDDDRDRDRDRERPRERVVERERTVTTPRTTERVEREPVGADRVETTDRPRTMNRERLSDRDNDRDIVAGPGEQGDGSVRERFDRDEIVDGPDTGRNRDRR